MLFLFHANGYFIVLQHHVSTTLQIFRENFYNWVLLVSALTLLRIPYKQLLLVLLPQRETRKEYLSKQIESMQASEAALVEYALRFDNTAKNCSFDDGVNTTSYDCQIYDTKIEKSCIFTSLGKSSSSLPCQLRPPPHTTATHQQEHDDPCFIIHGVKVQRIRTTKYNSSSALSTSTSLPPLVFLHGYAGGAFYFYRNLVGLASHFSTIYSIDLLGWGLSSRPSVWSQNNLQSVDSVESFFVESLERWRQKNFATHDKQPKIIMAAHSIGAYLSVAYCEKYSHFVQHLLLLSPVGVLPTPIQLQPSATNTVQQKTSTWTTAAATTSTPTTKKQHTPLFLTSSFRTQMVKLLWKWGVTPGMILRLVPERQGRKLVSNYIHRRFFAIQCDQEKVSLCNYLYTNLTLPGSGEYSLNRLLKPIAIARKPTLTRIPNLNLSHITFIYGEYDWMDIQGGLQVQQLCEEVDRLCTTDTTTTTTTVKRIQPQIGVLLVHNSGHLPMLENWEEFNFAILTAVYGEDYLIQHGAEKNGVTSATTTNRPVSLHFSNIS